MEAWWTKNRNVLLGAAGVLIGIVLTMLIRLCFGSSASAAPSKVPARVDRFVSVPAILRQHLEWADEQSLPELSRELASLHEFFAEASSRSRAFAEDALSLDSKWTLATDYFSGAHEHDRYMQERFAAHLFSP